MVYYSFGEQKIYVFLIDPSESADPDDPLDCITVCGQIEDVDHATQQQLRLCVVTRRGSDLYCAPEAKWGQAQVSTASDVFALAITFIRDLNLLDSFPRLKNLLQQMQDPKFTKRPTLSQICAILQVEHALNAQPRLMLTLASTQARSKVSDLFQQETPSQPPEPTC